MNTVSFSSKEKINQQASLWIAKLGSGLSKSQPQELNEWVALSKAHTDALIDYAELWDACAYCRFDSA